MFKPGDVVVRIGSSFGNCTRGDHYTVHIIRNDVMSFKEVEGTYVTDRFELCNNIRFNELIDEFYNL